MFRFVQSIPLVLRYGIILALGLILLKTLEYQLFSYRFSFELYSALLAVFFLLVGVSTGLGLLHQKSSRDLQQNSTGADPEQKPLSVRERKLLNGLNEGLTNQQLADRHHLSINTIKTHLKNLYRKLSVKNRAEAVAKANQLDLL